MKAKDLKNSILQMAIEGKLVPQDPSDEPASVLLERIREEKHKLIAEGKAKFPKGGESIIYIGSDGSPYEKKVDAKGRVTSDKCIANEVPFEELPEGWAWARLETVYNFIDYRGKTPHKSPSGVRLMTASNIRQGYIDYTREEYISEDEYATRLSRGETHRGDLLFTTEAPMGYCAICEMKRCSCGQRVITLQNYGTVGPDNALFCQIILSPLFQIQVKDHATGTTAKGIKAAVLKELFLPIPPLAEQRRIVERVNELMPLVEEYGELEDARGELGAALPGRLRKSVLQLAVQGGLVPQDPADEPAGVLLERIRGQRRQLVAEGEMKAPKGGESIIFAGSDGRRYEKRVDARGRESEPVCIEDEIPFEIPESWEWRRLGSLVLNRGQKRPEARFAYIDISSIDNVNQKLGQETVINAADAPSRARKLVAKNDVLYATVRPYLHNACIVDKDFNIKPIASTGFAVLSCLDGFLPSFLLYFLVSPSFDSYANANENAKGVAYPAINDNRLYRALVPVPPASEQKRIVSRVTEVFALTN